MILKMSELIEKGFNSVGKQCFRQYWEGDRNKPDAVCAIGASWLASGGSANPAYCIVDDAQYDVMSNAKEHFIRHYGVSISDANDGGMPIPRIVELLKAIGE